MLKCVIYLVVFSLAGIAAGDSSTMWIFPDGRGAMPIETEQITMDAESVLIVPTGNMINYDVPEMNVTCIFYLRNLTDQPLDVSVGFPFEDSEVPDWIQFRAVTDDEEYEINFESGVVNGEDSLVFWPMSACWEMHFEPGETVRLVNTYNAGWNYYWYEDYTASFTYIVRSGALWAGRIGDAVISITMPQRYPLSMLSDSICGWADWNGSPEIDGNRVTWHFTDWEPVEDITITSSGYFNVDDRIIEFELYGYDNFSFSETDLYTRWTPEEIYPAALDVYGGHLPAETITRFLENTVYGMSDLERPHIYIFNTLRGVYNGDMPFDQEKLEIVTELQRYFTECRINMESAGFDFLLPMTTLRRDWTGVNLEMYSTNPRDQAAYLLLLENMEDAVLGRSISDPALESLFWLTGWFLPGEVSPAIRQFTVSSYRGGGRDTTLVTREEVRNFWMNGGGCDQPLVMSTSDEIIEISQMTDLSIEASSEYSMQSDYNYSTDNLIDGNPETAWVEGVYGYGHGEVLTVSPERKIITAGFTIRNGYCKPGGAWWENARIRKFIICLNDSPLMVSELFDTMDMQVIMFPEHLALDTDDRLTFEILEIYPGATYQDAAISELSLILEQ